MSDGHGSGGVLVAFMAGAMVGAAVALLFAPATGEETREYLAERAREGRDRAAEAARQGGGGAAAAARQGREMVNRQKESLTTAFDRAREQFQTAKEQEQDA